MKKRPITAAALAVFFSASPLAEASAATYAQGPLASRPAGQIEWIQFWAPGHRRPPGVRAYPGWRGQPGWRGAPAWRGPPGWVGRPYWYGRPWVRRPYYGTIVAGVALGTLITVAAVGLVPPRPAPNLCWYWADPYGERGYWDYC
jgi:hypothetical protein